MNLLRISIFILLNHFFWGLAIYLNNPFSIIKRKLTTVASSLFIFTSYLNNDYLNQPAFANDIILKEYSNKRYHTNLKYPSDWEEKIGTLSSDRSVIAFTNPNDVDTSASIVITPIPADYTKLNSFGSKETIRQYLLPVGDGITTKLINEYIKGLYYCMIYFYRYLASLYL